MNKLYFYKWPMTVALLGLAGQFFGALLKVRHWPGADETLTVSSGIIIAGILWAALKTVLIKKPES